MCSPSPSLFLEGKPQTAGKGPEEELSSVSLQLRDEVTGMALGQKGAGCHQGCTQSGLRRTGKCFYLFLVVFLLLLLLKKCL